MKQIASYFAQQKSYLDYFFENVNIHKTEEILKVLLACKGTILFSGVGKSGIIAQKLANTMLSTGTKAMYIPATDAMHGDLGMVEESDLFIFLSKSGFTTELVQLLPYVKKKNAKTIALVSNDKSPLYEKCDVSILLPIPRELCPFDLAPTTSTEVQLIFGDLLAVMMMQKKSFSLKDYALNHPAGSIGKKITLKVSDLMKTGKDIPLARLDDQLLDVLYHLSEKKCGCLLIVNEQKELKGIFTDGDLRRSLQEKGAGVLKQKLSTLMTKSPRITEKDQMAFQAMKQMEESPHKLVSVLPVLERKKVVGIIRMHDILQSF